jgi:large subunit ribosomal protein L24
VYKNKCKKLEMESMQKEWSAHWKASTQPRKQRKYRWKAPLHVLGNFVRAHLSKDLRKKYSMRNLQLRTGDKVKILVGDAKGKEGKVSEVNLKQQKIYVEGMDRTKKDGSKARIPFQASNLMITALGKEDKRIKKKEQKARTKSEGKE